MDAEAARPERRATRAGGPRLPLDQMRILSEAIVFIDTNGLPLLTMRRLGAHLGVEAMALYRYVPGREQLLDGVVDLLMEELYTDTMRQVPPHSWQDFLQQMAHGVRRLAVAHPRIFPLVATRPPAAPWLRPPLRSLRWVEAFLEGLRRYGFDADATVAIYRAFATFLLGHLLLESSTLSGDPTLPVEDEMSDLSLVESDELSDYPLVEELSDLLRQNGFDLEFEDALEDLINRVALLRT